jgi:transposase
MQDSPTDGPGRIAVARLEQQIQLLLLKIEALESMVGAREERIRTLEGRVEALEGENRNLKRRLTFYENANTPPSQPTLKPANRESSEAGDEARPRGKPKGSRGATRKAPPIDQTVDVTSDRCPNCGGRPGPPTGVDVRAITERVTPATVTTTQYNLATHECRCGHSFTATHPDVPQRGVWGPLMLTHYALLAMVLRGRLRSCVAFLWNQDGVSISQTGFWDALQRVSQACKPEYASIREALRDAAYVYVDETRFKVQGVGWYLWTFRHPDGRTLVVLRRRRNADVVREILGDDPPPLVVDGHSAYSFARILQRCWSHLLREAEEVLRIVPEAQTRGPVFLAALRDVFQRLKKALGEPFDLPNRRVLKEAFDEDLLGLVRAYESDDALEKAVTYLRNGLGSWTTCLLYEGMQPTNNLSEQAIREHAVVRKLIGSFHSQEGAENYQYLASLFESWRFQNKNPATELAALLRRNLCAGAAGTIPPPSAAEPTLVTPAVPA